MSGLDEKLNHLLEDRKRKGRFRQLKEYNVSPRSGLVDFSSNDYLSMTTSSAVRQAYLTRLNSTPQILGSTGSRLLSGCTSAHRILEDRLADFFDSPSALLFNSGWDANVSFFSTVPQPGDWVIYDELIHASVHSGLRASRVPESRRLAFRHNDPEGLRSILKTISAEPSGSRSTVFLAVESLYSMDGDFAPIPTLLDVMDTYVPRERQCVVVDEAHSTGVYGKGGRGVVYALGENLRGAELEGGGRVGVRLMTFGKAVGCSGAVLLCSPTIRSFLINFARPFIFSTALPHSTLVALHNAWDHLDSPAGDQSRDQLNSLIHHLQTLLTPLLLRTPKSLLHLPPPSPVNSPFHPNEAIAPSPILALITPNPHGLSTYLLTKGHIVRPVVPPTVPPGMERVRICLRAKMDKGVLDGLVSAVEQWVQEEMGRLDVGRPVGVELEEVTRAKL